MGGEMQNLHVRRAVVWWLRYLFLAAQAILLVVIGIWQALTSKQAEKIVGEKVV